MEPKHDIFISYRREDKFGRTTAQKGVDLMK